MHPREAIVHITYINVSGLSHQNQARFTMQDREALAIPLASYQGGVPPSHDTTAQQHKLSI